MKVQMQFTRPKGMTFEEAEQLEKQGIEPEEEFYFDEAYIDITSIKVATKASDGNIKVWFENGDAWIIEWDAAIWAGLELHFEATETIQVEECPRCLDKEKEHVCENCKGRGFVIAYPNGPRGLYKLLN